MAAVGPHKPSRTGKPDVCPACGQAYQFRVREGDDIFRARSQYRHRDRGWVYVHRIDPAIANEYRWSMEEPSA